MLETWLWRAPRQVALCMLVSALCVAPFAACSDDSGPSPTDAGAADGQLDKDPGADGPATRDDSRPDAPATRDGGSDAGPKLPTGLKANTWNVLYPGGDTICSRGDKYMFAVNPGTVNKLVVDFEGGGACWTDASCSAAGALFKERAEDSLKYIQQGYAEGIYDRKNPNNPFKDWYHVFVPYCTGDIHWGDAVKSYGSGAQAFSINHKGAVNVRAVLDWIKKNFGGPEKIFVTGCSAGSYGSLLWTHHLIKQYPQAKVYQFGDSGAGVITSNFLSQSFPNWNALGAAPDWIPSLDPKQVDLLTKDVAYIYAESAKNQPGHTFSQYNTLEDSVQVTYFQVMGGGTAQQWSQGMVSSIDTIMSDAPSFRAYLAEGKQHCIIPFKEFYTTQVKGKKLVDWLADMVDDQPVQSQRCTACVPTTGP